MNNAFRQRCASALMHPVTLAALGVLLLNDIVFKSLWPGTWLTGKLSDLAWMVFAPPLLAFLLSFTAGRHAAQRAAFLTAYAGLPLLYAAFNTFAPVHDAILGALGFMGGEGPRSPLDPTDSLVIPFAMATAIWIWRRPPLGSERIRARLALLVAVVAALASVASSYDVDYGIREVGKTESGTLRARALPGSIAADGSYEGYESADGGLTWTVRRMSAPLETPGEGVKEPSGPYYSVDGSDVIRVHEGSTEVVYSYEYLQDRGNRWMQALDKRDVDNRGITTNALDLFYDDQSGNLIVAMGLQGVVVVAPDGTSTRVAVGRYSPTDFSFGSKLRTFFSSLLHRGTIESTGVALLLTLTFAALALTASRASKGPLSALAFAAATSAVLAMSVGVYPHVAEYPWEDGEGRSVLGGVALLLSGFGLIPLSLAIGGMVAARTSLRRVLAVITASVGMLLPVAVGALVLFETGPGIANFVAVGLVGLASFGLWAYQKRRRTG